MSKALLLVDHGSRSDEANRLLDDVAELIRHREPGLIVHAAHMALAEPTIRDGFATCVRDGATQIIVHPYMLSPGRHALDDIPTMVEEAAAGFSGVEYRVTLPLGLHPKLVDVILERAGILPQESDGSSVGPQYT